MTSLLIRRASSTFGLCLFVMTAGLSPLKAQSVGSITGTVLDQAGKTIAGASVTVKTVAGAVAAAATADDDGRFTASGLAAGNYTVETSSPGFARNTRLDVPAPTDISVTLYVDAISQSVTVQESISLAEETAPMANSLEAITSETEISSAVIQNLMTPVADFAEMLEQAPNFWSYNPNGIGLGQGKSFFRGLADGQYGLTFDDIPFGDTNDGTHHSWASFPAQWISSTDVVRSPGTVSQFGPNNFGGNVNMKSPELQADPDIRGTFSEGSWNTRIYALDFESGLFGPEKKDAVLANVNHMSSDGYQTYNYQQRDAGYAKYQHRISPTTTLTLYGGVVDIRNNTPDTTNPTRAAVAQYGVNYLMDRYACVSGGVSVPCSSTVTTPDGYYYGYESYHVQTDFEYAAFHSDFGNGWKIEQKLYTTRYWNKQFLVKNFAVNLSTSSPSGVDKLNGYRHAGDETTLVKDMKWGTFRFGTWYDWAYTDRYQYPSNPVTQLDTPLPNFHEKFISQSFQPFGEFEWRPASRLSITLGIKPSHYSIDLDQYQDNGKTVGCLGGKSAKDPVTGATICISGPQFFGHGAGYNSWLPNGAMRYRVARSVSAYAHFAEGFRFPPSSTFDVANGVVGQLPKATIAKSYQVGAVTTHNRWTLDVDVYYIHFQNGYTSYPDPVTLEPDYSAPGPSNTKGIEAEGNIVLGHGFNLYANAAFGSAKYQEGANYPNGGLWVANTPDHIFGFDPQWSRSNWDVGISEKVIGRMYNDNASLNYIINGITTAIPVNQAVTISPWDMTNVFINYRIKGASRFRGSKIQFAINNLANHHSVIGIPTVGIAPTFAAHYVPSGTDQLNLLAGRNFTITLTGGYAPRR